MLRCRITKEGFESAEVALAGTLSNFRLHPPGAQPGMVFVPRGTYTGLTIREAPVEDFWLDKFEVTNRQFKEFVDRGGYRNRDYWKHPFLNDGRTLTWEQAMAEFRDATGRPGPATWQLGTYPEGRADFPVNGVSWYEAAAYAEFAGKSLPTVDHWFRAAIPARVTGIVRLSKFGGQGPARVGSHPGLGTFGTYDMAGNVKEWCLNPLGERRYLLGGAWSEGTYLYSIPDAARPLERLPTYGFRCAKYLQPLPDALTGPLQFVSRDRSKDKPVGDDIFRVYRDLHSYDKTDLKPAVESIDDASEYWRKEKVSFAAAYGSERVVAYLFLPKNAIPPYETVVLFPGANALSQRSSERLPDGNAYEYVIRGGRALVYPVYKGTYERGPSAYYHRFGQPNLWREMNIQWSKDLGRTLDYLETRPEIDRARIAYYGISLGASMAPRLMAVEDRFRASVLIMGGFFERVPPEVDAVNFAPRVKIPVLMLNGRNDFLFPLQTSQLPLFRLLGAPEKDKRHVLFDGGHDLQLAFRDQLIKEVLDWLDRYLGPVTLR
jgi:dienelactone hydrolase